MKVLYTHKAVEINSIVNESIDEKSVAFTNKSTFCADIADFVELHVTEKLDAQTTKKSFKMGSYYNQ